ncbi:hypothetical protein D0Z00_003588 [Geotrichum galactomycetum]|uniref:Uncharacterized protein n=1 Tax=Geotrichum galactomycetum TaxID=27317 RepID=A0ACB6V0W3_9ASCO|nr:hypothetical protein D0Z00_003588 [Geotrichum candidum]
MQRSTATKREAKQYISRYTPLIGRDKADITKRREFVQNLLKADHKENSADVFEKNSSTSSHESFDIKHALRVAIIKIRDIKSIDPQTFLNIGSTITSLTKLGVSPIIVVDAGKERNDFLKLDNEPFRHYEKAITWKAAAIAGAIENASNDGSIRARPVEGLFDLETPSSDSFNNLKFSIPNLILMPLSNGIIPVVVPLAYDPVSSEEKLIHADDAVVFLAKELSRTAKKFLSIEKIIFIDPLGGVPSVERKQGSHVYVNLAQEMEDITAELHMGFITPTEREIHLANLRTLDSALTYLPPSATGLVTTPKVAALSSSRNPIIYNILTDRPIISPSLPVELKKTPTVQTTIVRKGMPIILLRSKNGIDLHRESRRGRIDLDKLWNLIEDSFGRKLDKEHYMNRINGKVAGIIIAGDYEGAAIITWEEAPRNNHNSTEPLKIISELDRINQALENSQYKRVAYLDKFAVRRSSQGAAGVADIVFKTMVMEMFPEEILWRSRKANPVNKWYFERSKGTLKLKDSEFCAFWTGSGTREAKRLNEYIGICSSIQPSWCK